MTNRISISAASPRVTTIDIEGIIGTPEEWQFSGGSESAGSGSGDQGFASGSGDEKVATYARFREAVERIASIDSRQIVVNIRSTGGNVGDALLIHDTLAALPGRVTTRCWGYVASAATIIAQGASKGRREMSANALYLIHKSVSATQGNDSQMVQTAELLGKTDRRIASIYASRSGREVETFAALMNENNGNGRWLTPREALEAGLIDRIVEPAPIANDASQMVAELGLPSLPSATSNTQSQKTKSMTLIEKWNAIVQIIAQGPPEAPVADAAAQVERLENSYREQIDALQNRIDELETANARLKAQPTAVKPHEDVPLGDPKRTRNQEAYMADARGFK